MKYIDLQNYLMQKLRRHISQAEIAKILGLDKSSISIYIKKDSDLKPTHKQKLEDYFGFKIENHINNDEILNMPICEDVSASLGPGREIWSEKVTETFSIPLSLMKKIGASPEHSCIINTDGESMAPTIIGGKDQVMIDESKREIFDGKIYLFRMENSLFAKRLQKLPKNRIKVISDNPEYESYIVDLNEPDVDFSVLGRVMWISRIL